MRSLPHQVLLVAFALLFVQLATVAASKEVPSIAKFITPPPQLDLSGICTLGGGMRAVAVSGPKDCFMSLLYSQCPNVPKEDAQRFPTARAVFEYLYDMRANKLAVLFDLPAKWMDMDMKRCLDHSISSYHLGMEDFSCSKLVVFISGWERIPPYWQSFVAGNGTGDSPLYIGPPQFDATAYAHAYLDAEWHRMRDEARALLAPHRRALLKAWSEAARLPHLTCSFSTPQGIAERMQEIAQEISENVTQAALECHNAWGYSLTFGDPSDVHAWQCNRLIIGYCGGWFAALIGITLVVLLVWVMVSRRLQTHTVRVEAPTPPAAPAQAPAAEPDEQTLEEEEQQSAGQSTDDTPQDTLPQRSSSNAAHASLPKATDSAAGAEKEGTENTDPVGDADAGEAKEAKEVGGDGNSAPTPLKQSGQSHKTPAPEALRSPVKSAATAASTGAPDRTPPKRTPATPAPALAPASTPASAKADKNPAAKAKRVATPTRPPPPLPPAAVTTQVRASEGLFGIRSTVLALFMGVLWVSAVLWLLCSAYDFYYRYRCALNVHREGYGHSDFIAEALWQPIESVVTAVIKLVAHKVCEELPLPTFVKWRVCRQ